MKIYGNAQFFDDSQRATQTVFVKDKSADTPSYLRKRQTVYDLHGHKQVVLVSIKTGEILKKFKNVVEASVETGDMKKNIMQACIKRTLIPQRNEVWRFLEDYDKDELFPVNSSVAIPFLGSKDGKLYWFRTRKEIVPIVGVSQQAIKNGLRNKDNKFRQDGWEFWKCQKFSDGIVAGIYELDLLGRTDVEEVSR